MEDINHHDTNQRLPLRLGIIYQGTVLPRWQASCISTLLSTRCMEIALIIKEKNTEADAGFITTLIHKPNQSFFNFYMRVFFRCYSLQMVDVSSIISVIPAMQCIVTKKGAQNFSDADIEEIRKYDLDLVLKLGSGNINGDMLNVARYGTWAFQHDRGSKNKSAPPFFWEIYRGENVTSATLQRLTGQINANIVLKEGFFRTVKYSLAKNTNQCLQAAAKWPAQVCIDIANGNTDYLDAIPAETKEPTRDVPNNLQMMLFIIKMLINGLKFGYTALFHHYQWNIGIVHQPIGSFLGQGNENSKNIQWLPPKNKNLYLADPFGIMRNKEIIVLCEDFDYRSRKGIISSIGFAENMLPSEPRIVIDGLPFHMSYPYLFKYLDTIYCIPETHQAREVGLYRAEEFPCRWLKVGTLLQNIAALDSTVFQHEGRWWLTCTDEDQGANLNLFTWYADDILGPWKPHSSNPIKTDIRSARPAGTPFEHGGHLYRPAQDCSRTYGGRVVLNRVLLLTPTQFKEEPAGFIEPDKNGLFPDGLHTLSSVGDFTLVDGKRRVFVPSAGKLALYRIISGKW